MQGRSRSFETVEPNAASLVESLRDIGYTLATAVADIVDNSLTAGASRIDLRAVADPENASLAILDDGMGMTPVELLDAMRPGSRTPTETRAAHDLGRFGLGLKTASFSQCRRLTVVTRRGGETATAIWDLDLIVERNEWVIERRSSAEGIPHTNLLKETGTLVVWEKLDRVGLEDGPGTFLRLLDEAGRHLELVFHRFMRTEGRAAAVAMSINGRPLTAADPFVENHPATQRLPEDRRGNGAATVLIQPFILPHRNKVSSEAEWRRMGEPGGHMAAQGFYLYRARRLIRYATWFGLARQHELTRLARVRLDIGNGSDEAWKIDVLKASAAPPPAIRAHLRGVLEGLGGKSRRVYRKRGAKLTDENPLPLWERIKTDASISYAVNPDHPCVVEILEGLDDEKSRKVQGLLRLVSAGLPLEALQHDMADKAEGVHPSALPAEEVRRTAAILVFRLRGMGYDDREIAGILKTIPPTSGAPEIISNLLGEV